MCKNFCIPLCDRRWRLFCCGLTAFCHNTSSPDWMLTFPLHLWYSIAITRPPIRRSNLSHEVTVYEKLARVTAKHYSGRVKSATWIIPAIRGGEGGPTTCCFSSLDLTPLVAVSFGVTDGPTYDTPAQKGCQMSRKQWVDMEKVRSKVSIYTERNGCILLSWQWNAISN